MSEASQPVIEATGICKTFRQGKLDVPVLKGIDIRVGVGTWAIYVIDILGLFINFTTCYRNSARRKI
jgi:hypothetical protein